MASHGAKKEIDPEELLRRKFRAKCLFRALGRLVMDNTYWLLEDVATYEGLDDVKRRVEQAVRAKSKKKALLNIKDKALLNKPAEDRTEQEKQYIYRIIGGLKCFKRYPNNVKRKLAAVTYFRYYRPGRVIVRQGQEAHAMYFILTGDVIVSQMIFDELLQIYQSVDVGSMHAGDMFGEVSLLHNILRTATVTTSEHCEMLTLLKEDFKNVLQVSLQKQWDEVRKSMSVFTYFDGLDEVARREGCIVAKLKTYKTNDVLLGDGQGIANFVYFILSGRCQMIESIQVIVTTRIGRKFYTLYDPYIPKEESEENLVLKLFGDGKSARHNSIKSNKSVQSVRKSSVMAPPLENAELSQVATKPPVDGTEPLADTIEPPADTAIPPGDDTGRTNDGKTARDSNSGKEILKPSTTNHRSSFRLSDLPMIPTPPPNLRTYFMQVCIMNPGSTFGFGENMRNRRIIALTPVECMLMPKIWLLQKNTANIWTRIQHFLDKKVPTTKQLFREFVSSRRWQEYKDQLVEDVIARSNTPNWTSAHDVPYSIRMNEMLDI